LECPRSTKTTFLGLSLKLPCLNKPYPSPIAVVSLITLRQFNSAICALSITACLSATVKYGGTYNGIIKMHKDKTNGCLLILLIKQYPCIECLLVDK